MHYYKFNISDWNLHTAHLTEIEELVYFRLINFYYDTEEPIPLETQSVARRLRLGSHMDTMQSILDEFFVITDDGYTHSRCDKEIEIYHEKANVNRSNGKMGGRPKAKKTQTVPRRNPTETLTTNQELLTTNHSRGTRLPKDWQPQDEHIEFCKKERPDLDPQTVGQRFKDYWVAQAGSKGVKLDWMATWRNWVRNEKQLTQAQQNNTGWRNDDGMILKKAASLNIYTTGKSKFEILAAIDRKEGRI